MVVLDEVEVWVETLRARQGGRPERGVVVVAEVQALVVGLCPDGLPFELEAEAPPALRDDQPGFVRRRVHRGHRIVENDLTDESVGRRRPLSLCPPVPAKRAAEACDSGTSRD